MYTDGQQAVINVINKLLGLFAVISFFLLILLSGFYLKSSTVRIFTIFIYVQMIFYVGQEIYRLLIAKKYFSHLRTRPLELFTALILLLYLLIPGTFMQLLNGIFPSFRYDDIQLIFLALTQISFLIVAGQKVLKMRHLYSPHLLHAGRVMMISFFLIIMFGTFLLMMPKAVPFAHPMLTFTEALFTSTSCVCVTGLSVVNVAKDLSLTGQTVMIFLMEVGGLGVLTITALFAMFANGGFSFQMRVMMGNILSEDSLADVSSLIRQIVGYTLVIELVGAFFMYLSLGGSLASIDGTYFFSAVFHSVAAFCNAGFSIYDGNFMNPIVNSNYGFLSCVMFLCVTGGLSFAVMRNITHLKPFRKRQKRLRFQLTVNTKLILITAFVLIFVGATIIYLLHPVYTSPNLTEGEKYFHSLFLSCVCRTTGFNSFPIEKMCSSLVLLITLLMAIGAAPGSTGGGIKTTTFAIIVCSFWQMLQGKERLTLFHREIHREYVRKALMVMFTFFGLAMIAVFFLAMMEPDKNIPDLTFEAVSALSTTGLSRNLTFSLGTGARYIIILLMFIGRIGVLSFFLAFHKPQPELKYKLPKESVIIG